MIIQVICKVVCRCSVFLNTCVHIKKSHLGTYLLKTLINHLKDAKLSFRQFEISNQSGYTQLKT